MTTTLKTLSLLFHLVMAPTSSHDATTAHMMAQLEDACGDAWCEQVDDLKIIDVENFDHGTTGPEFVATVSFEGATYVLPLYDLTTQHPTEEQVFDSFDHSLNDVFERLDREAPVPQGCDRAMADADTCEGSNNATDCDR